MLILFKLQSIVLKIMFRRSLLILVSTSLLLDSTMATPFVPQSIATRLTPPSLPTTRALRHMRGGADPGGVSDLVDASFGWTSNLGAPAALVAGAVIATLYENIRSGDLELLPTDTRQRRLGKKAARALLLLAFALEMTCIFVTTVTGTMLMSRELSVMDDVAGITEHTTPLSFLKGNFEFEYLTARITLLQGIFNWLAAIGLTHWISEEDDWEHLWLNRFIASALFSSIFLMFSFYNAHMTFYPNYAAMLTRWLTVSWSRFVWTWPPRPMAVLFLPSLALTCYAGYKAFLVTHPPGPVSVTSTNVEKDDAPTE